MFLNNSQNPQGNTYAGVTFWRTPYFTEHLQWLLLKVSGFQPATLLKKRLRQECFSVNFAKFLRTSFLLTKHHRMTASCIYLWILSFSEHFFHTAPPETAISCPGRRISTTRYSKKLFHRSFQAFYTRTRSNHSKEFIDLKSLKTVCDEVYL